MKFLPPPPRHTTRITCTRAIKGWVIVFALLLTVMASGFCLTVQADEKPFIKTNIHDVEKDEVYTPFDRAWRIIPRGQTQQMQFQMTTSFLEEKPNIPIAGYKIKLINLSTDEAFDVQTTDGDGMVTFNLTEDQIKDISHKDSDYLPETFYYGFVHEDGGYNQKALIYYLQLRMDQQEIGDSIYQGGLYIAARAGFSFKDTKVCTLELQPLTLDYGANFNPMDLVTKVGIDWNGDRRPYDIKRLSFNNTKFTYQDPDGKTVDTIDTTKPGVYQVTAQVFPFGTEKYSWCWDTQTTRVTVNPQNPVPDDNPQTDYTLTFDPNGGHWDGDSANKTFVVGQGQNFTIIPAPVKEGQRFLYWKGSEYQPGDSYVVEGDHTFTAEWASNDIPYIEIPVYPNQTVTGPVVEQLEPLPQPTGQVVVPSESPSPSVYDLPATGSADAGLTIWTGLGLALAGLLLKKRG